MFKQTRINFQPIKDTIQAAELLQDSGKDADSHKILSDLAKEILKSVKKP